MNYIVSQRALDLIQLECRRNPDTETGGILVGSRDANQLSITHATGPGLQWEASSYHFVKDTEYLQSVLKILFEYFGVNYLGVWHKHPRSMPHPSDGDISSAMEEVTDVNMGLEELVTPICIMESGHVQVLPFVIKAVAESLKGNPLLNSSWGEDCIIMKRRINIGIAVAAKDGLVVPVIHNADTLSIAGLALKLEDISSRARDGNLTMEEVQGGTFTVNNTGVLGSMASQPLVNYPQAAVMTTEAIVRRPIVVGDGISIRSIMNICLSFDHRIMDGQEASGFNMDVKNKLESLNENTSIY